MTIKEAYEIAVHRITDIDKEIAALKGRRDAYDEMRSCLYSMMDDAGVLNPFDDMTRSMNS